MALDIALTNYNEVTERYNFSTDESGDVAFDGTQAFAVMSSALCRRGGYWADTTHGSLLATLRNLTSRTPSQAEAMTLDALAPLQNAPLNLVDAVSVTSSVEPNSNRLDVDVEWTVPGGAGGRVGVSV